MVAAFYDEVFELFQIADTTNLNETRDVGMRLTA
jgi:hypothetical protein